MDAAPFQRPTFRQTFQECPPALGSAPEIRENERRRGRLAQIAQNFIGDDRNGRPPQIAQPAAFGQRIHAEQTLGLTHITLFHLQGNLRFFAIRHQARHRSHARPVEANLRQHAAPAHPYRQTTEMVARFQNRLPDSSGVPREAGPSSAAARGVRPLVTPVQQQYRQILLQLTHISTRQRIRRHFRGNPGHLKEDNFRYVSPRGRETGSHFGPLLATLRSIVLLGSQPGQPQHDQT